MARLPGHAWWPAFVCVAAVVVSLAVRARGPPSDALAWAWEWIWGLLVGGKGRVLSREEVAGCKAEESRPDGALCIVLLGQVFDVTSGRKHYGWGQAYSGATGRDSSRAFVTGDFALDDDQASDVSGLVPLDLVALDDWVRFYRTHATYSYLGVLGGGRFYDMEGLPTSNLKAAMVAIDFGKIQAEEREADRKAMPGCNVRFAASLGTKVWCGESSTGSTREGAGKPRRSEPSFEQMAQAAAKVSHTTGQDGEGTGERGPFAPGRLFIRNHFVPQSGGGNSEMRCVCVTDEVLKIRAGEFAPLSGCVDVTDAMGFSACYAPPAAVGSDQFDDKGGDENAGVD